MASTARPRWVPDSFQQAQYDIDNRPPGESHYLEFKAKIMPSESIRKSLASMAIDGGTIIYGIEEDKETRLASGINRVRLNGAVERIQQIARTLDPVLIIEEPLALADPTDPEVGIVVVNVPASAMAPHQGGGRYYLRAGTVSEVMSDAQVERYIKQRNTTGELAIDLFPSIDYISPHTSLSIWAAAVPRPVRDPNLLSSILSGNRNASTWIGERLQAADRAIADQLNDSNLLVDIQEPCLAKRLQSAAFSRRSGIVQLRVERPGWIKNIANMPPDPQIDLLEIRESAGVGLFANYLSTRRIPELPSRNFRWRDVTGLVYSLVMLSNELTTNVGYQADIDVALKLTGLDGCYPEEPAADPGGLGSRDRSAERAVMIEENYEAHTTWSFAELNTGSLEPLHRLLGPLLRSMGLENFLRR